MTSAVEHSDPSAADIARHFLKRFPEVMFGNDMTYDHVQSIELFPLALETEEVSIAETDAVAGIIRVLKCPKLRELDSIDEEKRD
ncbi:hypothetical protein BG003_008703 [Podila horticola]|nr:hypothetical protein BG003_008703 [Podila horticola]